MPRPSNTSLRDLLSQCQHDFATLANDEEWSGQNPVVTRKAVPILLKRVAESARYVVVITFTLESLRDPGAIRRVLGMRAPSVLLRSRWSHTEALLILAGDPLEHFQTMAPVLKNAGLRAQLHFSPYSGNVSDDYDRAINEFPYDWV